MAERKPLVMIGGSIQELPSSDNIAESDPVFNAWDKSTGIEITASQVSDFEATASNISFINALIFG